MLTIQRILTIVILVGIALGVESVFGHGIEDGDKAFIEQGSGMRLLLFTYLGAKHMVTGYDHLLFLFGVIFSYSG